MASDDPNAAGQLRADVERLAAQLDAAMARLEGSDAASDWKLRARLLRLEAEYLTAHQPRPDPRPVPWPRRLACTVLDVLERLSPMATPVILALFGVLLTGTTQEFLELRKVELAEQELDLATIQALEGHLAAFRAENVSQQVANQQASQIAYFGPRAIVPLVAELRTVKTEADPRAQAIKSALQISALYPGQRPRLCAVLAQAMAGADSGAFSKAGQQVARTVIGAIGCAPVQGGSP